MVAGTGAATAAAAAVQDRLQPLQPRLQIATRQAVLSVSSWCSKDGNE
jgi:hypothetical protein